MLNLTCIRDMAVPAIRAAAIADGTVWSGPLGAIAAAERDILTGRVPFPDPTNLYPDEQRRLVILRAFMDAHGPEGR